MPPVWPEGWNDLLKQHMDFSPMYFPVNEGYALPLDSKANLIQCISLYTFIHSSNF